MGNVVDTYLAKSVDSILAVTIVSMIEEFVDNV